MSSIEALCIDSNEFFEHKKLVDKFATTTGPTLDQKIRETDMLNEKANQYPHSYIEQIWDDMYLTARCPNPNNNNPSYILNLPKLPCKEDRFGSLAKFTMALITWHNKVILGKLDASGGDVCFSPFGKQLGTARIPKQKRDYIKPHPNSKHIVVFCGSEIFSIQVQNESGEFCMTENLKRAFENIFLQCSTKSVNEEHLPISLFTSDNRDEWATTRDHLIKNETNKQALECIDSALISIALDGTGQNINGKTASDTDLSTASLLGNAHGGNKAQPRWFDKHQLISLENGEIAYNFEHSYSDGMSWNRMLSESASYVQGVAPPPGCEVTNVFCSLLPILLYSSG